MKTSKILLLALLLHINSNAAFQKQEPIKQQASYAQRVKQALLSKNGLIALSAGANVCLAAFTITLMQRHPELSTLPGLLRKAEVLERLNAALDKQVKELNEANIVLEAVVGILQKRRNSADARTDAATIEKLEIEYAAKRAVKSAQQKVEKTKEGAKRLYEAQQASKPLKKPAGRGGRREFTSKI